MTEIQIQATSFQWAWNTYPETRLCLFHVPNGGSRNKIEAAQLKASGVIPGIPDLIFIWKGHIYAFEAKTQYGKLSDVQKALHDAWKDQGITVSIFRSIEEFKSLFISIL